jgi:hypothetical protein
VLYRRTNIHPIHAALWGERGELSVVKGARGGREWDNQVKMGAPQDDQNKGGIAGVTIADLLSQYGYDHFDFVKARTCRTLLRARACATACC